MSNAIIYCRVSSDRQAKEGHGLDGQEHRCRKYAAEHGYQVAAVFRDEGVSGGLIEREGMENMLDYLDREAVDGECIVVIDDIKRLARDLMGHFTLRKAIQTRGARLESPSHKFSDDPEGLFVESIMAATAELERNQNKRQVRNRMQARLEAGYWPFYPPPGYTYAKVPGHGKLLVPKEPEASIIREALEGFASGKFPTQTEVQHFLQSKEFKDGRYRKSKATYLEQVKRILTRDLYAGYVSYSPWNVTTRSGHHRPLVDADTFERIQERLSQGEKLAPRKDLRDDFPVRGFVLCSECRKPYTSCWAKGRKDRYAYYFCHTHDCPARNKSVRGERLHGELEELLQGLRPQAHTLAIVRAELLAEWREQRMNVATVRRQRKERLKALQKEIDGYVEAIQRCSSALVIKNIEEKIGELEAKMVRLGGQIAKPKDGEYDFEVALDYVLDFLKNPFAMWQSGSLCEKRLVLRLVFAEPLAYDLNKGIQTPTFSLPVAVACALNLTKTQLVDMLRKSSNRFLGLVKEWREYLKPSRRAA